MTPQEVDDFLRSQRIALVAGHQVDGRLTSRRAWFRLKNSTLLLDLDPPQRCFDLASHPSLCFVVDVYPSHATIKSVIVHGPGAWQDDAPSRIKMRIERIVSFDFAKQPEVL